MRYKLWNAAGFLLASIALFVILDVWLNLTTVNGNMSSFDWYIFNLTGKGWLFATGDIIFWSLFGGAILLLIASVYLCLSYFLHGKLEVSASSN